MELDLFNNLKDKIENSMFKSFKKDLEESLKEENETINEQEIEEKQEEINEENSLEDEQRKEREEYRKEGHLYMVEEDIHDRIFLWDITDKPEFTIEEVDFPKELLELAKEGTVFKFENGEYQFYSRDGYEMIDEEN